MEKVYYISQGKTSDEHLANITKVCEGGVRLIQLRMKNISDVEYLETAKQAVTICHTFGSQLIVNDNLSVAIGSNADGLHLGKNDILPKNARESFRGMIGGTANTLKDCENLIQQEVDYIGLGPFRYTETKQNLSPILGFEGIRKIVERLDNIPVYAIGGIVEEDIKKLFCTNICGVAISGLLTKMKSVEITRFMNNIRKYNNE